ncbi:uncharacterized protein LOC116843295 [Odontomachus brunneus]|uniref:uncharacterized protein LOC116843295 n=1 Tax=Odontomachus brunneus TaxID=486640 RepID=UPI0013F20B41|nr:uncharacterized protein LOC116843295 [Odontomachus brunneus]
MHPYSNECKTFLSNVTQCQPVVRIETRTARVPYARRATLLQLTRRLCSLGCSPSAFDDSLAAAKPCATQSFSTKNFLSLPSPRRESCITYEYSRYLAKAQVRHVRKRRKRNGHVKRKKLYLSHDLRSQATVERRHKMYLEGNDNRSSLKLKTIVRDINV